MAVSKEIRDAADKAAKAEAFWNEHRVVIIAANGIGFFLGFGFGLLL